MAEAGKPLLKTSFVESKKFGSFYTGGKTSASSSENFLVCPCGDTVKLVDVNFGNSVKEFPEDAMVTATALSPDDSLLATCSANLSLKIWDVSTLACKNRIKGHAAPVADLAWDFKGKLIASAGADATVKVWNAEGGFCTHNFRGHGGIVYRVAFYPADLTPTKAAPLLVSCSEDATLRVWDLTTQKSSVLKGHFSAVTSFVFCARTRALVSGGRDKVLCVWSLDSLTCLKTIPVMERIEALAVLPGTMSGRAEEELVACGGSSGVLKVWDVVQSRCVQERALLAAQPRPEDSEDEHYISGLILLPGRQELLSVCSDHSFTVLHSHSLGVQRTFVGLFDEVIDVCVVPSTPARSEQLLALATNSEKVYIMDTSSRNTLALVGHSAVVLAVAVSHCGSLLASASKDHTVRLWKLDTQECLATLVGHTEAVAAVCFSHEVHATRTHFLVSASADKSVKMWDVRGVSKGQGDATALHTVIAHAKDINCVAVAPSNAFVASASQDKTVKLWRGMDLQPVAVLKGHKRGVWCVAFSPIDKVLASSSADRTVKLWSMADFSCIRTLEGHQNSVLRVAFITHGTQLVTSSSDGLLKLWTIKTSTCVATMDGHSDKVWAMCVTPDEREIISGGADSQLVVWEDHTQQDIEGKAKEREERAIREQSLQNCLRSKDYGKAFKLALESNHSMTLYRVAEAIFTEGSPQTLVEVLRTLKTSELGQSLTFLADWNTKGALSHVAQHILHLVLTSFRPEKLMKLPNASSVFSALTPYTQRHFERVSRLLQNSFAIDYHLNCAAVLMPAQSTSDSLYPFLLLDDQESLVEPAAVDGLAIKKAAPATTKKRALVENNENGSHDDKKRKKKAV